MIYSYSTGFQTVSAVQELLIFPLTVNREAKIRYISISSSDAGTSQGMQVRLLNFSSDGGSGGSAVGAAPYSSDDFTNPQNCYRNRTTLQSGTSETILEDCFDHQMGWIWEPPVELAPSVRYRFVVRLVNAPSPAVSMNATMLVDILDTA